MKWRINDEMEWMNERIARSCVCARFHMLCFSSSVPMPIKWKLVLVSVSMCGCVNVWACIGVSRCVGECVWVWLTSRWMHLQLQSSKRVQRAINSYILIAHVSLRSWGGWWCCLCFCFIDEFVAYSNENSYSNIWLLLYGPKLLHSKATHKKLLLHMSRHFIIYTNKMWAHTEHTVLYCLQCVELLLFGYAKPKTGVPCTVLNIIS